LKSSADGPFPALLLEMFPNEATFAQIGQSSRSEVFRVREANHVWIVKCFGAVDAKREQENWRIIQKQNVPIMTPRLIESMSRPAEGVLVYADDFLRDITWSKPWMKRAVQQLTLIHQTMPTVQHLQKTTWEGVSHTPVLPTTLLDLAKCSESLFQITAEQLGLGHPFSAVHLDAQISRAQEEIQRFMHKEDYLQNYRLCHGDSHLGNFLWSPQLKQMYLIDWEYLHVDHVYFDIYQMLDATSPFAPLVRPIPRLEALAMYYQSRQSAGPQTLPAWTQFLKEYETYATVYLGWTLTRIVGDISQGRFPLQSMRRQWKEIAKALLLF
jgi:Phosphotransferase enzyme family